jgi:(+)-trans-carveol dehydrogenase/(-)-trans-carveol dehydrogenase
VALVSGAARGQGRAHAIRLAEEGADIIAFDVCGPVPSQGNPAATSEDMAETVKLIEGLDRRVVAQEADARDYDAVAAVVGDGVAELGGLDIVVVNHGITGIPDKVHLTTEENWRNVLDTNLTAVWHVAKAGIRVLVDQGRGGSVVLTSSAAGIRAVPHMGAYVAAKHGVIGLMRALAHEHAEQMIRVNSVNPTAVSTPMIHNDNTYRIFRPDLENPTAEDCIEPFRGQNLLPIPWVEPVDVSNGVLFLASDEARYVTGVTLPIDGGNVMR